MQTKNILKIVDSEQYFEEKIIKLTYNSINKLSTIKSIAPEINLTIHNYDITKVFDRMINELYIRSDGYYKIPFNVGATQFGEIEVLVENGIPKRAIMDLGSISRYKTEKLEKLIEDD